MYVKINDSIKSAMVACRRNRFYGVSESMLDELHVALTGARNVTDMKQNSPKYDLEKVLENKHNAMRIAKSMRLGLSTSEIEIVIDNCINAIRNNTSCFGRGVIMINR